MDVALLSELFADTVFEIFKAQEWTNPADHPGSLSRGQFHRASIGYRYSTSTRRRTIQESDGAHRRSILPAIRQ